MVQAQRFFREMRAKGYDISEGSVGHHTHKMGLGFDMIYIKDTIFVNHLWVNGEVISVVIIKKRSGYQVKVGELLNEKEIGKVHSQREVIIKLRQALGM